MLKDPIPQPEKIPDLQHHSSNPAGFVRSPAQMRTVVQWKDLTDANQTAVA
jgi:hypothetical protein